MDAAIYVLNQLTVFPAGYFAMKSSEYLLPIKEGLWRRILLISAYMVIISVVIFIGDRSNLPPVTILFMAAVMICYRGSKIQRFTIGLMFCNTMLAFNGFYDNLSSPHWGTRIIIRLIFWAIFYVLIKRFAPPKDYELSPVLWRLILFLTALPMGITCALVMIPDPHYTFPYFIVVTSLVCFVICLVAFIGLMWTIIVLAKQQQLEQEVMMGDMNKKYYEAMEQQQFEVRRLRHDLANHLQTLSTLPASERDAYVAELIKSPAMGSTLHYCGDNTVNAVISAKVSLTEQESIGLESEVDIAQELPYDKVDVCALFANALDNAIEACRKLPVGQRWIQLKARAQKGLFADNSANPIPKDDTQVADSIRPGTTKTDKISHGYGLKSIKEIVSRHGGSMEIKTKDGQFQLFLYMPLD